MHNAYMNKNAAITIRVPASLKRRLAARARTQHRSLSAEVMADLETIVARASDDGTAPGRFLGLFEGTRIPTDPEIEEARSRLWGPMGGDRG
jgi:hypothetical protein